MISIIPVGAFSDNYVWMLRDGMRAVAVDPGNAAPVLAFLDREGLALTAILATHHHGDHVGGIPALRERFAVPVLGPARESIPARTRALEEGDRVDELGASIGFARSICDDDEVIEIARTIQRELFAVCAVVATEPEKAKGGASPVTQEMVDALDAHVARIEATEGIFGDWALPGDHTAAAAFDVARTICRRAERVVVRLGASDAISDPQVLVYLNRLSDLLWLIGRLLEVRAGIDSKLRAGERGPKWSKAW